MTQSSSGVRLIGVVQKTEVSAKTATYVLAEPSRVKLGNREMVKRVAMSLRYQQNLSARDPVLQSLEFPWFGRLQFQGMEPQTPSNPRGLSRGVSSSETVIIGPKECKNTWAERSLSSNYRDVLQKLFSKGLFE